MKYIIDSNCFIQPHRTFCPTDVGVSFWNKILDLASRGVLCTLDKVKDELYTHSDDLKSWMSSNLCDDFYHTFQGDLQIQKLESIISWASTSTRYNQKAKEKFLKLDKADIYLVAFASADPTEWKIVSMEQSSPNNQSEIKLPDVCNCFGVSCIKPQDMFREIGETF